MRNSNNLFNKPEIYVFPTTKIPEFWLTEDFEGLSKI